VIFLRFWNVATCKQTLSGLVQLAGHFFLSVHTTVDLRKYALFFKSSTKSAQTVNCLLKAVPVITKDIINSIINGKLRAD
jgi:hypothetical protein